MRTAYLFVRTKKDSKAAHLWARDLVAVRLQSTCSAGSMATLGAKALIGTLSEEAITSGTLDSRRSCVFGNHRCKTVQDGYTLKISM
jgi:hypothetical protein